MKLNDDDINKLAQDVFDDVIENYQKELNDFRPKLDAATDNIEMLIVIISEMSECLRRHSERFSIELVKKTVEKLQLQES